MSAVTITRELVREIASDELCMARKYFHAGRFSDFAQGEAFGAIRMLNNFLCLDDWIAQGIRNELWFMVRETDARRIG
ncbi:MAG: hypothetical protein ACM3WS_03590 [Bacillota bacterium]